MIKLPFPLAVGWRSRAAEGLALLALLPLSCTDRPQLARRSVVADEPVATAPACPDWRWIGLLEEPGRGCPRLDGWISSPLFEVPGDLATEVDPTGRRAGGEGRTSPAAARAARCDLGIPPALRPFCQFEFAGPGEGPTEEQVGRLLRVDGLQAIERDCMAVGPAGDPIRRQIAPELQAVTLAQAGRTHLVPRAGAERVRLALLDTEPTNLQDPPSDDSSSPHGYTLAQLAERLLCAAALPPAGRECVGRLVTELALPFKSYDRRSRTPGDRDEARGGYLGSFGDLAQAVRRQVAAWQGEGSEEHLVLNLSLGWASRFGGTEPSVGGMNLGAQAVHRALRDAVCRGALVVAAAGNHGWGPPSPAGPIFPAGWERHGAPTRTECQAATGQLPPAGYDGGFYRPLVHAVSGVRQDGTVLTNHRPGAAARLAAFGDQAIVGRSRSPAQPGAFDPRARALTGTSVSAVIAASAATAAWYYRPDLNAFEIMDLVYASSTDLGRQVDFCRSSAKEGCGRPSLSVRRVSVAGAAAAACQGSPCPALPTGSNPGPRAPLGVALSRLEMAGARRVQLRPQGPIEVFPECRFERHRPDGRQPLRDPCPRSQFFDVTEEPWVGPQPGPNMCPNCTADLTAGQMLIAIDEGFEGALSSPTISVGGQTDTYALPGGLKPGDRLIVSGVGLEAGDRIVLSATVDGDRSANSPFLIVP